MSRDIYALVTQTLGAAVCEPRTAVSPAGEVVRPPTGRDREVSVVIDSVRLGRAGGQSLSGLDLNTVGISA